MTVVESPESPRGAQQSTDSEALRIHRQQLELARVDAELRKYRLQAVEDYLGFIVQKTAGVGALGLGVLEALHLPLVSAIHVDPLTALGAGAAVLLGKAGIRVLKPLIDALATK